MSDKVGEELKMEIEKFSDDELKMEIERRKKRRREKAISDNNTRMHNLRKGLTKEVLDALLPLHGRTSCSDEKRVNGFGSNGPDSPPRCSRCALLEFIGGYIPDHWSMSITVNFTMLDKVEE